MSVARTHHRFSLADYEQMVDLGILTENDRVELIRGEIIEKMSIGEFHAACVRKLTRLFTSRLGDRASVSVQNPVVMADSEPEPDVTLLVPREDEYAASHPGPDDIVLVVEVSDASLAFDRHVKGSLYAENGVAEFWILNLLDRTLEVHRQPQPGGQYADVRILAASDVVDLAKLPDVTFTIGELFPPVTES
jgi:Uma2 family endonuclease